MLFHKFFQPIVKLNVLKFLTERKREGIVGHIAIGLSNQPSLVPLFYCFQNKHLFHTNNLENIFKRFDVASIHHLQVSKGIAFI